MSLRSARSLLSAAHHYAAPSTSRALSSSAPAAAKGVLSPLHKTAILRRERAAKGAGRSGQAGNEAKVLPLEDAAKLLQVRSPFSRTSPPLLLSFISRPLSPRHGTADPRNCTQERSRKTPNAAYEINITTKPSGSVQLNALRGRVFLPHSCTSATKRETLYVFAQGAAAQKARDQGADVVGGEELIEQLMNGSLAVPDKLVTTSDMFALFQRNPQLARLLGPRGLMPSVKRGTVADDVEQAIKEARGGLDWKGDSKGVVRAGAFLSLSLEPSSRGARADTDRARSDRPPALHARQPRRQRPHAPRVRVRHRPRRLGHRQRRPCARQATCVPFSLALFAAKGASS